MTTESGGIKRVPFEEGKPGPRGHVLAEIEGHGTFWVDPKDLKLTKPDTKHKLSGSQKRRLRKVRDALKEHGKEDLAKWEDDLASEADPERELRIFETMAKTYEDELEVRPWADARERALVYLAILSCSLTTVTVDDLLARDPRLKALPNLDRLVAKYVENQKNRERRP